MLRTTESCHPKQENMLLSHTSTYYITKVLLNDIREHSPSAKRKILLSGIEKKHKAEVSLPVQNLLIRYLTKVIVAVSHNIILLFAIISETHLISINPENV